MTAGEVRNDFLLDLLDLQQDGKNAISAPTNWATHSILLEVRTELDDIIDELQNILLFRDKQNVTARWHFFIGSPGNGKSATVGKLCKKFIDESGCQVLDEQGVSISNLEKKAIPYVVYVYEGKNKFPSVQIVQDASVVPHPFSDDIDPAKELLKTLEKAWEKGISLVVCTNRGVLEKAHRDNHTKPDVNSTAYFRILKKIVQAEPLISETMKNTLKFDSKKTIFKDVKIGYSYLDNRSLLLGRNTFSHLIQKATDIEHWGCCTSCSVNEMCPFKLNRDWLADDIGRQRVIQLLTRAEVYSGQVIVFREALTILSLILAGCPSDYNSKHPCEWIRDKVVTNDIFALASRRIYMDLFTPHFPHGLEHSEELYEQQLDAFKKIQDIGNEGNPQTLAAIKHVVTQHAPSTDVGVPRRLGENGTITILDPCREALPAEFYETWDSYQDTVHGEKNVFFTKIEKTCVSIWKDLEEMLELAAVKDVHEIHWALRRWSSNFLLHFGALYEGYSAWAKELDDFAILIGVMNKLVSERSIEDKRRIRMLDERLENLLNTSMGWRMAGTVKLSDNVTLEGKWVARNLQPRMVSDEASRSLSLAIEFGEKEMDIVGEETGFTASMYLWLTRQGDGKLDNRCFPQELLTGITDARVRAASRSRYAFDNKVELVIAGLYERFKLIRIDGDVDVHHE